MTVRLDLTLAEFAYLQRAISRDLLEMYVDADTEGVEEYVTAEHVIAERVRRLLRSVEQQQVHTH